MNEKWPYSLNELIYSFDRAIIFLQNQEKDSETQKAANKKAAQAINQIIQNIHLK